jgi:hypothetical protein
MIFLTIIKEIAILIIIIISVLDLTIEVILLLLIIILIITFSIIKEIEIITMEISSAISFLDSE